MVWQYPADGSNSRRSPHNAIQGNLANLHKSHGSAGRIDDEVIEDVFVGIY